MTTATHTVGITREDTAPLHVARDSEVTLCGQRHSNHGRRYGVRCGRRGSRSVACKSCLRIVATETEAQD